MEHTITTSALGHISGDSRIVLTYFFAMHRNREISVRMTMIHEYPHGSSGIRLADINEHLDAADNNWNTCHSFFIQGTYPRPERIAGDVTFMFWRDPICLPIGKSGKLLYDKKNNRLIHVAILAGGDLLIWEIHAE